MHAWNPGTQKTENRRIVVQAQPRQKVGCYLNKQARYEDCDPRPSMMKILRQYQKNNWSKKHKVLASNSSTQKHCYFFLNLKRHAFTVLKILCLFKIISFPPCAIYTLFLPLFSPLIKYALSIYYIQGCKGHSSCPKKIKSVKTYIERIILYM
jgi:hypothetical protein